MKRRWFIFLFLVGCKDSTTYQSQISIRNKLSNPIEIRLFPKLKYSQFNTYLLYEGGSRNNIVKVQSGQEYNIISKPMGGMSPIEIISERFDSVEIYTKTKILKFKPQKVENYMSNLFEDLSSWDYKKNEREFPTQFKRNTVLFDDYYFNVDSLKIKN